MNKVPKLLAVIDYQNDFVTGPLGFEGAAAIDDGIARLAQTYLAQGDHVLFTYDTHDDTYLETREGRALPIPHCNPGETGWRLYGKPVPTTRSIPYASMPSVCRPPNWSSSDRSCLI